MKKIIYLLVLVFTITLVNTSCEKESIEPINPPVIVLTLEQKYPDWKNLTWESTNGNSTTTTRPQFSYKIVGNVVTESVKSTSFTGDKSYDSITITGNVIKFYNTSTTERREWLFEKINNKMKITSGTSTIILY